MTRRFTFNAGELDFQYIVKVQKALKRNSRMLTFIFKQFINVQQRLQNTFTGFRFHERLA